MTRRATITGTRKSRTSPHRENELPYSTFPHFWGPNPPKRRVGEACQKEPRGPPTLPQGPPKSKDVAPERSHDALESTFGASLLSFRFFSASLPPLGPFWHHFGLILEPLGPQKPCIFIKKVAKFKLVASFAFGIAWGQENQPKTVQITPPGRPKGPPEEPRSAQESPRRAPRASRNHPQRALRVPLGVQKVSWGGFGSLRASFWSPQG